MPVLVPCGQCIGCRLEKSRQWAIRCVHEATPYIKKIVLQRLPIIPKIYPLMVA